MTAEVVKDAMADAVLHGMANQFWHVAQRDETGRPTELRRIYDVEVVYLDGRLHHYAVGHPSRRENLHPDDVVSTVDLDYYRTHPRRSPVR